MATLVFNELNSLIKRNNHIPYTHSYIKVSTYSLISVGYSITQDCFNYVKLTLPMNALELFKNSSLVFNF